ncbi:hypothetical protein D3C76_1623970 [compost metagenome]
MQALAEGPVADLVMVLQEQDEGAGWQVPAGFTACHAMAIEMTLEHEPLAQATRQLFGGVVCVVGVIGLGFAGQ